MAELLVVSDIFGFPKSFTDLLALGRRANRLHRCFELPDLSGHPELIGDRLHNHLFAHDGLELILERLLDIRGDGLVGLGYSAGGTALWHAVSRGLKLKALICVSSTRLRHETSPLPIQTHVFWGGKDENRPSEAWNKAIPTSSTTYADAAHGFYQDPDAPPARTLNVDILKILARIENR
jgi:hypothetical protein